MQGLWCRFLQIGVDFMQVGRFWTMYVGLGQEQWKPNESTQGDGPSPKYSEQKADVLQSPEAI